MSLLNPFTWFARASADKTAAEDEPQFSRRAVDSDDLPMECMFSMRMSTDMREDGSTVARAKGFSSLAEFQRYLLRMEIRAHFDHVDRVFDEAASNAMHKGRGRE